MGVACCTELLQKALRMRAVAIILRGVSRLSLYD